MTRRRAEVLGRVLSIVGVVRRADGGLVRYDENARQAPELLRDRRDVVVADQNVLVLLLYQLVAGRHDHFDHVLSSRQHRRAVVIAWSRVWNTDRAVRARSARQRLPGGRVPRDDAREL